MTSNFKECLDLVLQSEGGWTGAQGLNGVQGLTGLQGTQGILGIGTQGTQGTSGGGSSVVWETDQNILVNQIFG